MPPRSNWATSQELELIIDAVRPKTSDSQQEGNYNPHAHKGQIGLLGYPAYWKVMKYASGLGFFAVKTGVK